MNEAIYILLLYLTYSAGFSWTWNWCILLSGCVAHVVVDMIDVLLLLLVKLMLLFFAGHSRRGVHYFKLWNEICSYRLSRW